MVARYRRTLWETIQWNLTGRKQRRQARINAFSRFKQALESAPDNAIAIDCGANIGDITEQFLSHGFRVIAFEPDPMALEVFKKTSCAR